jgi:hypothetical protein
LDEVAGADFAKVLDIQDEIVPKAFERFPLGGLICTPLDPAVHAQGNQDT